MKLMNWIFFAFMMNASIGLAQNSIFKVDSNYLSKHDIVYKTPAFEGFEGFPLGNGDLGGMIWNTKNGFEIQINKNDLFDQSNQESEATLRGGARVSIDLGNPGYEWVYLKDFEGRLSLKNAEVSFKSETSFVYNKINSWVSADKNIWFIRVNSKNLNADQLGSKIRVGLERYGSRAFAGWYGGYSKNTSIGLGNTRSKLQTNDIIIEESLKDLEFSIVCRMIGEDYSTQRISTNRVEIDSGMSLEHNVVLMIAVVTSNESDDPTQSAISLLDEAEKTSIEGQRELHLNWWKEFWDRSFVHLGNDYIENIYYLRRYLMGSSSRGKYPVVFNGGLWTWNHDVRNWVTPHHWNTQQQYWGLAAQNDTDLMLPYINTYFNLIPKAQEHAKMRGAENSILWSEAHDFFGKMTFWDRADMINNFTPATQIASIFWEYYQFTSDKKFLKEKAYPFMKKAAEFYVQTLQWNEDINEYFIYPSQPYESPRSNDLKNPITDRNMLVSTMKNCIEAADILKTDKGKIKKWQHIIDHTWPIPFRVAPEIGEVMELAYNPDGTIYPSLEERGAWTNHFSANTSLVFPSNLIGLDDKGSRSFLAASNVVKNHEPSMNAISPDPIVAARLGLGDVVLERMNNGIRRLQHFPQGLFYNIDHWYNISRYMDSVQKPDITTQRDYIYDARSKYPKGHPAKPFIQSGMETMSTFSTAVNEMLVQSNEGKIRVFPAVPINWESTFKLRARGGFLVSSERKTDGTITGVEIESLLGGVCKLVNPWPNQKVSVWSIGSNNEEIKARISQDHTLTFETIVKSNYLVLPKGQAIKEVNIYKSTPNDGVKHFFEASLGKKRNF